VPLLAGGTAILIVRDTPTRFQGVSHEVVEWTLLSAGIVAVYTGVVAGLGRLVAVTDFDEHVGRGNAAHHRNVTDPGKGMARDRRIADWNRRPVVSTGTRCRLRDHRQSRWD